MKTAPFVLSLFLVLPYAGIADEAAETRQHALRFFSDENPVVRASVAKSFFWQTVIHDCPLCKYPVNDIITTFKVEECYSGDIPVGTLICCFHRHQTEKNLKEGDVYIFPLDEPVGQVQFLDTGILTEVANISKRYN